MDTEPIAPYLRRKLKEAGMNRWQPIADLAGCNYHTLRKFVHSPGAGLNLKTAQPLLDLFHAIDRGERELPAPVASDQPAEAASHG